MHDANIRVAIAGAGGRMGRQLIQAALALEGVQLGAALEREGSSLLGSDAGELAGAGKTGVTVQSSLDAIKDDFDVFIDFTRPEGTLNHLAFCRQHGKGMVIGTTGFDEAGKQAINRLDPALSATVPQTNIVQVETADTGMTNANWVTALEAAGLLTRPWGRTRLRCVTHRHIDDSDIDTAVEAFKKVLASR